MSSWMLLHSGKTKMNQTGNTILSENICDLLLIWNIFSLFEWDSLFRYTFYFYSRMENLSQQNWNEISILNYDTRFESVPVWFATLCYQNVPFHIPPWLRISSSQNIWWTLGNLWLVVYRNVIFVRKTSILWAHYSANSTCSLCM